MRPALGRIALALVLLAAVVLAVLYRETIAWERLETGIEEMGWYGPIAYMLIYALGTVLFLPGSILTLAAGALFGPWAGTFYSLTGATLGATLAFLVARYLTGDWVARRAGGRLKQLLEGVEAEGWRFVAFMRLVPLFPFNLLNYVLGLTRIPLAQYVIASYVFMLPGSFAYTYLGYVGREAATGAQDVFEKVLIALALLAALIFLPRLIRRLRARRCGGALKG